MNTLQEYKQKLEEALQLFQTITQNEQQEAVSCWNIVASKFQEILNGQNWFHQSTCMQDNTKCCPLTFDYSTNLEYMISYEQTEYASKHRSQPTKSFEVDDILGDFSSHEDYSPSNLLPSEYFPSCYTPFNANEAQEFESQPSKLIDSANQDVSEEFLAVRTKKNIVGDDNCMQTDHSLPRNTDTDGDASGCYDVEKNYSLHTCYTETSAKSDTIEISPATNDIVHNQTTSEPSHLEDSSRSFSNCLTGISFSFNTFLTEEEQIHVNGGRSFQDASHSTSEVSSDSIYAKLCNIDQPQHGSEDTSNFNLPSSFSQNKSQCEIGETICNDQNNIINSIVQHRCEICGKSGFSKGNLKRHIKTHTGEKNYKCDICMSSFTENRSLKVHMRSHSNEPKRYGCSICLKRFTQQSSLDSHMACHTGQRKFVCQCGAAFKQRSQLKTHELRHKGTKNHECSNCIAKFLTKGDLKRHFRIHTGERLYKCDKCGQTFTRQQSLNEHLRRHLGKKPYL